MRVIVLLLVLAGLCAWSGCASRPETKPITKREYQEKVIREGGK